MSWIKPFGKAKSLSVLKDISRICSELGGKRCRDVYQLVLDEDYAGIINFDLKYDDAKLSDLDDFIYARQILAFFQKADFLPLSINREEVAYQKFRACEAKCQEMNSRWSIGSESLKNCGSDVGSILFMAQRKISNILGEVPPLDSLNFAFGPGASTNVKSGEACPRAKLSAAIACSSNMVPWLGDLLSEVPEWSALHGVVDVTRLDDDDYLTTVNVEIHPGKLMFVPKSSKTDRPIVVEPILNSFFQKGVGSYIRHRLNLVGVDLRDQGRNRRLAEMGSITGQLSTVDLSSASDLISRNLVRDLLPEPWFELLDALRTPTVAYGDELIHLHKFSSMGNGYTFELESLIFYSIAHSVCCHLGLSTENVSVFGDDIIIPSTAYTLLEQVLTFCGFEVNLEKSFSQGPFRESCGADFLFGIDIRPYYVREVISCRTLFTMHNFFFRHGERKLAMEVEKLIPNHIRLYGPDGYGDGHLLGSWTALTKRRALRDGWGGVFFDTYTLRPRSFRRKSLGDYVLPVYSVYVRSGEHNPTDPNVVRGSVGYAKISIYTFANHILAGHSYALTQVS